MRGNTVAFIIVLFVIVVVFTNVAVSSRFFVENGPVDPRVMPVGIVLLISMIEAFLLLVGGSIVYQGTLRSTFFLNFHGKITYRVLPFFQSNKEGFEILHITESTAESTNISGGLFYAIDTKRIRGGAEAIPRDGTPFKFVKGVDGNDIVIVKVPHENNAVSVQHSAPAK